MALSTGETEALNEVPVPGKWKECNKQCNKTYTTIQTML